MPETTTISDEQLQNITELLAKLSATPEAFLNRSSPQQVQFKRLRAELNRCVASLQTAAVQDRKSFNGERSRKTRISVETSAPKPTGPGCYMCGGTLARPWRSNRHICFACGSANEHYLTAKVQLYGQHAVVTGGRMGVGFEVVRRLLECGATVHVTTRFPFDAGRRLAAAVQYGLPTERLRIYGLDFRDLSAVRRFAKEIRRQCDPSILINNAAQTVRMPVPFYHSMAKREFRGFSLREAGDRFVVDIDLHRAARQQAERIDAKLKTPIVELSKPESAPIGLMSRIRRLFVTPQEGPKDPSSIPSSALLSQVPLLPGDVDDEQWLATDEQGEPADLRKANTWTETIEDVSPVELVEVQCVNSIAPFLLTQGLFLGVSGTSSNPKFVVNLAAAEGSFEVSHRRGTHPHTNMAKAALNMLTRTIAHEFAQRHVFVNSVDPGWVSDQRPYDRAMSARAAGGLLPPLDFRDGAARVMHPIVLAIGDIKQAYHGKLLRHYRVSAW